MSDEEIQRAKKLLERKGYIVARVGRLGWRELAVRLKDDYVAFHVAPDWKRSPKSRKAVYLGTFAWVTPKKFSEALKIDRHTLTRKLKQKDCPRGINQVRGPKGRLVRLEPTQELIDFLRLHL